VGNFSEQLWGDSHERDQPFEVRRLGPTIHKWATQIVAWHQAYVSNGPQRSPGVTDKIKISPRQQLWDPASHQQAALISPLL